MFFFVQASRHQAHKNGTIFKVKVTKTNWAFLMFDGNDDDDDDDIWVEAYQLKSCWSDFWENKQAKVLGRTHVTPSDD